MSRHARRHASWVAALCAAGLVITTPGVQAAPPGTTSPSSDAPAAPDSSPAPSAAPQAAAGPGDFTTSFETGQPQPLVSTVEKQADGSPRQRGVSGTADTSGSLLGLVTGVSASSENTPSEIAANLADANPDTKWLAFQRSGWVQYQLSSSETAVTYSLTSANDAPERDPASWVLQGSADGTTWTDLDRRSGVTFADRFTTNSYQVASPGSYRYYRLDISSNQSGSIVQLADWNIAEKPPTGEPQATPMVTTVGSGPISGYNIRPLTGWTGKAAMRYSGAVTTDARGYAWNVLYRKQIPVGSGTTLSYKIFPDMIAGNLTYPSTYAAVDLHFTDGTYLSDLKPVDLHQVSATPSGQGEGKILYSSQWNSVQIEVGKLAAGKTIDRILIGYDNTDNTKAGTRFGGWLDDLQIAASTPRIDGSDLTNYVDVRRGTNSSGSFSRGNNLPISALPNGFTFFTPVTDANSQSWQYYYQQGNNADNKPVLEGLGISHEPSPWMGDRNQMSVMPTVVGSAREVPNGNADARGLPFDHATETARPDYYKADLETDLGAVRAEMTPADHGGMMRFTFPRGSRAGSVVLDTVDNNGVFTQTQDKTGFTGWVDNGSGLSAGRSRMFVVGQFDRAATSFGAAPNSHTGTRYANFAGTRPVTLRLATSFISLDQARKNLQLELAGKTFEQVRAAANSQWNKRLSVLTLTGANDDDLRTTYSNLYRLNLYPNSQFENTGTAQAPRYQYASPVSPKSGSATDTRTNAKVVDGKIYVNNGFWDTYRTVWPAYTLLYPEVAAEIADGFVQQYRDGGWVARWSSPGYADLMTGTSSDVAIADAYLGGVKLPDPLNSYDAALKNATTLSGRSEVGRKGIATSIFTGYTSTDTGESVSWGLEGFINDFGIGNMAAALAKDPATPQDRRQQLTEESEYFLDRTTNYVNMFNPATQFFQGRNPDGSFTANFDPESWGGAFTESNGWNFAFHAPQDGNGLANLYGGRQGLADKLDTFFATPEKANKPGGYGGVIHEMLEARDVRMGQLGMSNQVSHHIPYMYNYAGQQYKTAEKVREIMQRLFTGSDIGQGYPGDEDNGEMSAWYLLSALGIYPLQVGSPELVIGSPRFTKAVVHRAQGNLTVNAPGNSAQNIYVQSLSVNGKAQSKSSVQTSQLAGTATLDFTMGAAPSSFGSAPQDAPTSLTTGTARPDPMRDVTGAGKGTASASSGGQSVNAAALFDNTSTTFTAINAPTAEIGFQLSGAAQRARYYTLTSGPAAGDPTAWRLEGSSDGKSWTTLDQRSGQKFNWRNQTRPFKIATPAAFTQYRLVITASSGAAVGAPALNLAEVEFLADGTAAPSGPTTTAAPAKTGATASEAAAGTGSTVRGDGFAPGEKVTLRLAADAGSKAGKAPAATVTATANARGAVTATLPIPAGVQPGSYGVTLQGARTDEVGTAVVAVSETAVERTSVPQVLTSSTEGRAGQLIRWDANTFAPGEKVTVRVLGAGVDRVVGSATANADGVVTDQRLTIPELKAGSYRLQFTGATSGAVAASGYQVVAAR